MLHTVKKKIASGALLLLMAPAVTMTGCSGPAGGSEPGIYVPGTYTGEGEGKGGPVSVTLTVDGDNIVSVDEIIGEKESISHGQKPIEDGTYVAQILEAQSADIDGVSGSTKTTKGVKQAVADALDQASSEQ